MLSGSNKNDQFYVWCISPQNYKHWSFQNTEFHSTPAIIFLQSTDLSTSKVVAGLVCLSYFQLLGLYCLMSPFGYLGQ